MNISDVKATNARRPDLLKNSSIGSSDSLSSGVQESTARKPANNASDRVEISDEARQALASARGSEELSMARRALENLPPLTEDRISELTDRIRTRYYEQADIQSAISQLVGNELRKDI